MNFNSNCIAVYGATGHTGRFVVQEVLRRGLPVVAVARNGARLASALPEGVQVRAASVDEPSNLVSAFAGCSVVINCAGPFLDTAAPVARAALLAGCHYIDVTAEQASAQATFAEFDTPARERGLVVIPAAAFYGGLADLLASALADSGFIDEITVAIGLSRWWPTVGTRVTGMRNNVPRVVMKNGQLQRLEASPQVPDWVFSDPLGRQAMIEVPFSEVITMTRHLDVGNTHSLLTRSSLDDIRDPSTPPPAAADEDGRSAQRFEMVVRVVQGDVIRTVSATGQDIYAMSAPIVTEAALRLLRPSSRHSGALALAQAMDPIDLLRALGDSALHVHGDLQGQRPPEDWLQ